MRGSLSGSGPEPFQLVKRSPRKEPQRKVETRISITTAINSAISPFAQPKTEPRRDRFLVINLSSVSASDIAEEFREHRLLAGARACSKSAAHDEDDPEKPGSISPSRASSIPAMSAYRWMHRGLVEKSQRHRQRLSLGELQGVFSTMELLRNGRPVTLTSQEFKTLAYPIKNPRRVISRDELLSEVWDMRTNPCTRTVDNHILKLRKKTRIRPRPSQALSYGSCVGYRFLPRSCTSWRKL